MTANHSILKAECRPDHTTVTKASTRLKNGGRLHTGEDTPEAAAIRAIGRVALRKVEDAQRGKPDRTGGMATPGQRQR